MLEIYCIFNVLAVGFALNQVPIDLSQYALDLCKPLASTNDFIIELYGKNRATFYGTL